MINNKSSIINGGFAHFESLYPDNSRFNEINQILTFIKKGQSCQVIGLPGVGRSNLFGLLVYNTNVRKKHLGEDQKNFHFVEVNFSEVSKRPLSDVLRFFFLRLTNSLKERKMLDDYEKCINIFKDSLNLQEELVLVEGLKDIIDFLCLERKLTVVLLLDRFEQYVPMLSPQFFTYLSVLQKRARYQFSTVFSLTHPIEQFVDISMIGDFYTSLAGHAVFLPISDAPSLEFRLFYYTDKSTKKKLSSQTKETILRLTSGHGKMTRISAEEILTNGDIPDVEDFLINNKAVRSVSYEIWEALTPAEREALKKISLGKSTTDQETEFLRQVGLVNNAQISIPLFSKFVEFRAQQKVEAKIVYDADKNQILKGEEIVSDKLTKAEFLLLRFLIENQEKIIERDEIVKAVWSTPSTEGVTDQAIDQLVFRLRKKIEETPNTPNHIQTIKGRGIKFTP